MLIFRLNEVLPSSLFVHQLEASEYGDLKNCILAREMARARREKEHEWLNYYLEDRHLQIRNTAFWTSCKREN